MDSGRIFGKAYRVERALGAGGVGAVFEVTQIRTGRRYALKMLLPEMALHHGARERFQREAEVLASMGHAGIVQIHDFDSEEDGTQFLVMDLLRGEDLATRLAREGAFDLPTALRLLEEVSSALSAAHARGIVHRDLKPANIFLAQREGAPERAMLLDFGLAKNVTDSVHLTATGVGVGTPLYMSPEQARGAEVDARTDVYALGSVLYEMLVGVAPFMGPSLTAVLAMILTEPPPRLSEHAKRPTPRMLDEVIETALAKSPEARFPTVEALLEATRKAAGNSSDRALAATALPADAPGIAGLPRTRQDLSARSVDLDPAARAVLSPSTQPTVPPTTHDAMPVAGQALSGDAHPVARTAPALWVALGVMAAVTLMMGGAFLQSSLAGHATPREETLERSPESEPEVVEPVTPPSPAIVDDVPTPPQPAPANANAVPSARPRRERAQAAEVSEAQPVLTQDAPRETLETQARDLMATLPPDQQAAFRAQASATARSYQAQIASNERRIQEWEAHIQDVIALRREAHTVSSGHAPAACTGTLRTRLEANTRGDDAMVSSISRGLEEMLVTICDDFDEWASPSAENVRRLEAIGPAIAHAESMLADSTGRAAPAEDRATVATALAAFRRVHEAQPATFARYPCSDPAIAELARAGHVGHAWCGAAAEGVYRRVTTACNAMRMSEQNVAQQARVLTARTEAAESSLRTAISSYQDMNETLRGGIAHQSAIAQ